MKEVTIKKNMAKSGPIPLSDRVGAELASVSNIEVCENAVVENIDLSRRSILPKTSTQTPRFSVFASVATQNTREGMLQRRIIRNRISAAKANGIKQKKMADLKSEQRALVQRKEEAIVRLNNLKAENEYLHSTIKHLM